MSLEQLNMTPGKLALSIVGLIMLFVLIWIVFDKTSTKVIIATIIILGLGTTIAASYYSKDNPAQTTEQTADSCTTSKQRLHISIYGTHVKVYKEPVIPEKDLMKIKTGNTHRHKDKNAYTCA